MFTTINTKKILFTLIGTIFVICVFSSVGCNKLSEQDKQWLSNLTNTKSFEKDNAELKTENKELQNRLGQLTKDNAKLKTENEELQNRLGQLTKDNNELTEKVDDLTNGNGPGPPVPPKPDKIFRAGDKLPPFTFNDVTDSSIKTIIVGGDAAYGSGFFYGIHWVRGILTVQGTKYGPGVIAISNKKAWIELKDGTRYVCLTEGGCIISQKDYTIIRGEIIASYKK